MVDTTHVTGCSRNTRVLFSIGDFVCPHHREFASRFFDSSSDSEWDSDDSYYDYDTDEDDESGSIDAHHRHFHGTNPPTPMHNPNNGDFFYSFHTHSTKPAKPVEPGAQSPFHTFMEP